MAYYHSQAMDEELKEEPRTLDELVDFKAYVLQCRRDLLKFRKKVAEAKQSLFFMLTWQHPVRLHPDGVAQSSFELVFKWPAKFSKSLSAASDKMSVVNDACEGVCRVSLDAFEVRREPV